MMWNALVSSLLLAASIVMIDGNPAYPDLSMQWRLAEETQPTLMGASPALLMGCRKAGLDLGATRPVEHPPARRGRLAAAGRGLRLGLRAARPRRAAQLRHAAAPTCAPGIVQGSPLQPVYARRDRRAAASAVDTAAFDPDGNEVVGELGELVIRAPMPSMPVGFWNDPGRRALPRRVLRRLPRRLAPRRLDPVHRARQLRDHRPLRRDAQPRRRAAGHGRVLRGRRGARRGARQPRRAPRGPRGRRGRAAAVRRAPRRGDARRRPARAHRRGRCAARSRRATCPTRSRRCPRSRAR